MYRIVLVIIIIMEGMSSTPKLRLPSVSLEINQSSRAAIRLNPQGCPHHQHRDHYHCHHHCNHWIKLLELGLDHIIQERSQKLRDLLSLVSQVFFDLS